VLRCRECDAAVAFSVEKQAPSCAFCGSVMEVEQPVDPVERAELGAPFLVDRDEAASALRRWLGGLGWFRPSDLASEARVDSLRALHFAAWIFEARALVSWTADSDAGSGAADWAPHAGQTELEWDALLVPASRGLGWDECRALAGGYRLDALAPLERVEIPGDLEEFDVQRSAARKTIMEAVEATAAERLTRGAIPGRRFRNVNASVMLERVRTRRVALPAWVLAYRYRGRRYRAVIGGHDARHVLGVAPWSIAKIALVAAAGAAAILLLLALLFRA
jgi:hypothetical protein